MMVGLSPNSEKLRENEFYALRDISFSLRRGEAVGIMGMNGAGKSTLLKVILGRLPLDSGSFSVAGSVGGLVELNAGFHDEMTGIENIYNRARLLGKSDSEVRDRIDGIIDFADIGEFIDSPVKTYSSGMTVRLGFAIAIHFVEDLVLCDEILAVGDFDFRQKCLEKINELRSRKSFVLVSHSTTDISNFCNRAILLHKGEMILEGVPEKVIEAYALCDHHLTAVEVRNVIKESTKQIKIRSGEVEGVKVPEKPKRKKLFIENPNLNGFVGWTLDAKWTNP
jgi:lipopolysaccharide transport system ATP-binding protein